MRGTEMNALFTRTIAFCAIFFPANLALAEVYPILSDKYVSIDPKSNFKEKVIKHISIFRTLIEAEEEADKLKIEADSEQSYIKLKRSQEMNISIAKYQFPYASASIKAEAIEADGGKIKNYEEPSGEVCNEEGECSEVDPIIAAILTILGAVFDEANKDKPFGPNNDLVKFLKKPAGSSKSAFVIAREAVIAEIPKDNEIGKALRDPARYGVESTRRVAQKLKELGEKPEQTVKQEIKRLENEGHKAIHNANPKNWKFN